MRGNGAGVADCPPNASASSSRRWTGAPARALSRKPASSGLARVARRSNPDEDTPRPCDSKRERRRPTRGTFLVGGGKATRLHPSITIGLYPSSTLSCMTGQLR